MFTVELGVKVSTRVTKQTGIITARSENLYGCNRYFVQPEVNKDGKVEDGFWTDEGDVVIQKGKKIEPDGTTKGGPMSKVK